MIKFIKALFTNKNKNEILIGPDPEVSIFVGECEYRLMFDKKGYVRYKINITNAPHATVEVRNSSRSFNIIGGWHE